MDSTKLEQEIRRMIDRETMQQKMSEKAACEFATEVLDPLLESYNMRLQELEKESNH